MGPATWREQRPGDPTFVLAPTPPPGLGVLAQSPRVITRGLWIVYSLLTTPFAHLIGPKPVAWVTNCVIIWLPIRSRGSWIVPLLGSGCSSYEMVKRGQASAAENTFRVLAVCPWNLLNLRILPQPSNPPQGACRPSGTPKIPALREPHTNGQNESLVQGDGI